MGVGVSCSKLLGVRTFVLEVRSWSGRGFLGGSGVKNLPVMQEMQEMWVCSLDQEDSLQEAMATHSNIPAQRIPWTEESGRLQSMAWQSRTWWKRLSTLCLTLGKPMDCSLPGSSVHGIIPGKNTVVSCHFSLHGNFSTQGLNPHLLHLYW